MASLNKVMLIGNLGKDPERYQRDGGPVSCSFSLATTEAWRDKNTGERKDKTEWHRVTIWSENIAKVALQYLKKGSKVYVEGQIQSRKYTDKKDNIERTIVEVVLQNFNGQLVLLDAKGEGSGSSQEHRASPPRDAGAKRPDIDDEIPF